MTPEDLSTDLCIDEVAMDRISEPILFSAKEAQTIIVVPFPTHHLREDWEKKLVHFEFKDRCFLLVTSLH